MDTREKLAWLMLFLAFSVIGLAVMSAQYKVVHGFIDTSVLFVLLRRAIAVAAAVILALFFFNRNSKIRRFGGV